MTAKSTQKETLSTMLIGRWENIARKITTLAEEFPEEKFEYRPLESVRTFGDVLRHLAFWNQYVADSLSGKQVDDSSNEVPLLNYPTKARIVEVLERNSRPRRFWSLDLPAEEADLSSQRRKPCRPGRKR